MRTVLNWSCFLLVGLGVVMLAGPTSLGGPASYVMVDGTSMEPTYHDGDLVIAYASDSHEVGDIIVYDAELQGQYNVIHRVIEPTYGGYVTQGDNRDEPDGWIARPENIRGVAQLHIPHGGRIVAQLRRPTVVAALGAGLVMLHYLKREEDEEMTDSQEHPADGPDLDPGGSDTQPMSFTARP